MAEFVSTYCGHYTNTSGGYGVHFDEELFEWFKSNLSDHFTITYYQDPDRAASKDIDMINDDGLGIHLEGNSYGIRYATPIMNNEINNSIKQQMFVYSSESYTSSIDIFKTKSGILILFGEYRSGSYSLTTHFTILAYNKDTQHISIIRNGPYIRQSTYNDPNNVIQVNGVLYNNTNYDTASRYANGMSAIVAAKRTTNIILDELDLNGNNTGIYIVREGPLSFSSVSNNNKTIFVPILLGLPD